MWNGVDALRGATAEDAGMHTTTTKEDPGHRRAPHLFHTWEKLRREEACGEGHAPLSGDRGEKVRALGSAWKRGTHASTFWRGITRHERRRSRPLVRQERPAEPPHAAAPGASGRHRPPLALCLAPTGRAEAAEFRSGARSRTGTALQLAGSRRGRWWHSCAHPIRQRIDSQCPIALFTCA